MRDISSPGGWAQQFTPCWDAVSQLPLLMILHSYLVFLSTFSLGDDRGLETRELCLMGAGVLPLLLAPGAVVLFRCLSPCPVLHQGRVQANQAPPWVPTWTCSLPWFLATEFGTCFAVFWPHYSCVQYESHPMAQEAAVLWRESPSSNSINVEGNFQPGAESCCLWSQ